MRHWGHALAALVDDRGHLMGTGFVCEDGVLITCAHNFGTSGNGSEVIAIFGEGETQRRQRFRVAPKGWFPRRKKRLSDEPNALCDVAILMLVESSGSPPQGPKIVGEKPSSGTIEATGYYAESDDIHKDKICAELEGVDHPGWIRAKPTNSEKDAPRRYMSGSPVFHENMDGVVGMLAYGQEERRGMWLLVPAETLTLAIRTVIGDQPTGPKLWVDQVKSKYWVDRYATCEISSPRQRHHGGDLSVDFDAHFLNVPDNLPRLRQVEVAISIPDRRLERQLGNSEPYQCRSGIEIKHVGRWGPTFVWKVRAPEADGTLHGRNAVPDESLFDLPAPLPGQCLMLEMVAFANNRDFAPSKDIDIPDSSASDEVISRARQTIIERLKMKRVRDPQKNGEIILCVTRNEVKEVPE